MANFSSSLSSLLHWKNKSGQENDLSLLQWASSSFSSSTSSASLLLHCQLTDSPGVALSFILLYEKFCTCVRFCVLVCVVAQMVKSRFWNCFTPVDHSELAVAGGCGEQVLDGGGGEWGGGGSSRLPWRGHCTACFFSLYAGAGCSLPPLSHVLSEEIRLMCQGAKVNLFCTLTLPRVKDFFLPFFSSFLFLEK